MEKSKVYLVECNVYFNKCNAAPMGGKCIAMETKPSVTAYLREYDDDMVEPRLNESEMLAKKFTSYEEASKICGRLNRSKFLEGKVNAKVVELEL